MIEDGAYFKGSIEINRDGADLDKEKPFAKAAAPTLKV
jgi:hypothetical protein